MGSCRRIGSVLAATVLLSGGVVAQPRNAAPAKENASSHNSPFDRILELVANGDFESADKEAKRLGQPADIAFFRAKIAFARGALKEAHELAAPLSGGPRAPDALSLRVDLLRFEGRNQDALKLVDSVRTDAFPQVKRLRLAVQKGALLIEMGKRGDADAPLRSVTDEYPSIAETDAEALALVGRAAHLLRSAKDANQAFTESEKAEKKRVETLLYRAELFLEKYDPGHAAEVTREALALGPKAPASLVMMARVRLDQSFDFDGADALAVQALAVNSRYYPALAIRAGIALRDLELDTAEKYIREGLAVNPSDLELLSLRAASRFLADDAKGFESAKREVLTRNPNYAGFYVIVSDYAEWEHRYDDIVKLMKEAVTVDPGDGRAWAQLGLTQMRNGDEPEGMKALQKAWEKDRFNVRVYNTLNMYEKSIATSYETQSLGPFRVRFPKSEAPILQRYMPTLFGEAWASMKSRYGFVPHTPIQIELYESTEHFSVRTSGLPNIGIQGVCFGRVVASMSPRGQTFNWGNVLWHELGHVFAIQMSNNHVPRWFTEGLSEYETLARRPEWNRELDPQLFVALKTNALPGVVNMNRAFTHASSGLDMTIAYYASSQLLVFTVERFGMPRVVQALKLWGQGMRTPEVIKGAFGIDPAQYDAAFRSWALARLSRYEGKFIPKDRAPDLEGARARTAENPKSADAHADYAHALLAEKKLDEAKNELERAIGITPNHLQARYLLAKLAGVSKDADGAKNHLDAILAGGGDGYALQMAYADYYEAKKETASAKSALSRAFTFDPSRSEPLQGLFDLAVNEKKDDEALLALQHLARLDQHDPRVWRGLIRRLADRKMWEDAKSACESAMYVDVESPETHLACGKTYLALGLRDKAVFEAESAELVAKTKEQSTEAKRLASDAGKAQTP